MSKTQRDDSDQVEELSEIFVSVTGDESVTESQDAEGDDRELRGENQIDEAVADGLSDALDGAGPDGGDPGKVN
jgi:hypothetical protein